MESNQVNGKDAGEKLQTSDNGSNEVNKSQKTAKMDTTDEAFAKEMSIAKGQTRAQYIKYLNEKGHSDMTKKRMIDGFDTGFMTAQAATIQALRTIRDREPKKEFLNEITSS